MAGQRRNRRTFGRVAMVAAALPCIAVLLLGVVARLRPGELDDKTAIFMSSGVSLGSLPSLLELRAEMPTILERCGDSASCEWRSRTRISTLLNYLAAAKAMDFWWSLLSRTSLPDCTRIAYAYSAGFVSLHLALYALFLALLWTDRSTDRVYSVLALLMLVAAVVTVLAPRGGSPLLPSFLPAPQPHHSVISFVPRGALGFLFIMQVASFASGRNRSWALTTLLSPFVHGIQSMLLNGVFLGAWLLRIALLDRSRSAWSGLAVVATAEALGFAASRALGTGLGISLVGSPFGKAITLRAAILAGTAAAAFAALVWATRGPSRPAWLLRLATVMAPLFALLASLDLASQAYQTVPMANLAFERVYANAAPALSMLPLLAIGAAIRALVRRNLGWELLTVAIALVLATTTATLVQRRDGIARWAWRARANASLVPDELCRWLGGREWRGADLASIRPLPETLFHLQVFDHLQRR